MSPEIPSANRVAPASTSSRSPNSDATHKGAHASRISDPDLPELSLPEVGEAEAVLSDLARVFSTSIAKSPAIPKEEQIPGEPTPNLEAKYRALLEQIPAVVFMAYLDRGISEAYVSPQIEAALGYSREEWLEDPVR